MTVKTRKSAAKKSVPKPMVTSESLRAQTDAFLESGGTIEQVKPGVSGYQNVPGRKHITLDSKSKG